METNSFPETNGTLTQEEAIEPKSKPVVPFTNKEQEVYNYMQAHKGDSVKSMMQGLKLTSAAYGFHKNNIRKKLNGTYTDRVRPGRNGPKSRGIPPVINWDDTIKTKGLAFTQNRVHNYMNSEFSKGKTRKKQAKDLGISVNALNLSLRRIKAALERVKAKESTEVVEQVESTEELTPAVPEVASSTKKRKLSSSEKKFIKVSKRLGKEATMQELADEMGVSIQQAYQLNYEIKKKLGKAMKFKTSHGGPHKLTVKPEVKPKARAGMDMPVQNFKFSPGHTKILDAIKVLNGKLTLDSLSKAVGMTRVTTAQYSGQLRRANYDVPSFDKASLQKWKETHFGNSKNEIERPSNDKSLVNSTTTPGGRELNYVNIMLSDSGTILHLADISDVWVVGNNVKLKQKEQ